MSKLNILLEKYKQIGDGGEQDFMDKHTDNIQVTSAPNANNNKSKTKKIERKKTRHGHEPEEDVEVYEDVDEELNSIIEEIIEQFYLENDDDLIGDLEEMLETEEGQTEFLDIIFEELTDGEELVEEDEIEPPLKDSVKSDKSKKVVKCGDCDKYPCECEKVKK